MNNLTQKTVMDVVHQFGTPAFLYDTGMIEKKYRAFRNGLSSYCDIFYSMKANPLLGICQYFSMLGTNCEVSSSNELLTALRAGFLSEQIIFVGPGKNKNDLALCISNKIRAIVCESIDEIKLINYLAESSNVKMPIWIRLNPDFHIAKAPIKMSGIATQFGIEINQLINAYTEIKKLNHVSIDGIHVYNASRVLDVDSIIENARKILALADYLSEVFCIEWKVIDVGGGLGVSYFQNETELDTNKFTVLINALFSDYQNKHPETRFVLELGRFLIAESGCLISTVQSIKHNHKKNFAIVDAGMHCHLAITGLGSFIHRNFQAKLFSQNNNADLEKHCYQIAGPLCTPGDILLRDFISPHILSGDCIVIFNTGAYGVSASPGKFLSHGSPAEIIIHNNKMLLARRREFVDDLLACQTDLQDKLIGE